MLLLLMACPPEDVSTPIAVPPDSVATTDSGGGTSTSTTGTPWLTISDPGSVDADEDGFWNPGESLTLQVVLRNNWSDDYLWYPGVVVSSPDEGVSFPDPGGDWRYAMAGHTEDTMNILVEMDPSVEAGTTFHFELEVTSLSCENEQEHCVDPGTLSYERTVD